MKLVEVYYKVKDLHKSSEYCLVSEKLLPHLNLDDEVIVETSNTVQTAIIKTINDVIEEDMPIVTATVLRKATTADQRQETQNDKDSDLALSFAQEQAKKLKLDMHFVDSFYTFDRKQLYLTYVADMRIDFRELTKILAQKYKTRIELRQIGVRDKAKKIGGLGPCGLFLCCNTFLTDFISVSINMAKNQNLALNPSKINGLCGRLLCCLNYEDQTYTELKKNLPSVGTMIESENGLGKVIAVDILRQTYTLEFSNKEIIEVTV